jgi:hypothetical protein
MKSALIIDDDEETTASVSTVLIRAFDERSNQGVAISRV